MTVTRQPPTRPAPLSLVVSDDELVRRVRCGDARAFEAIFHRYREPLHRFCHSITQQHEDAEEVFQATMLAAHRSLTGGDARQLALRPWLYRVARNECISTLRRRALRAADTLDGTEPAPGGVEESVAVAAELAQLRSDLAELGEAPRSALVMRELAGLSHAEIGRILDEPAAAVKQLIYQARQSLLDMAGGRELTCERIRQIVSDGDGRALRGRTVRAHLRACPGCEAFRRQLQERPAMLVALAPPLPAAVAHHLLGSILGSGASSGGMAATSAAMIGAGVAGGGAAAGGIGGASAVTLVIAGSVALIGGGAAIVSSTPPSPEARPLVTSIVRAPAAPATSALPGSPAQPAAGLQFAGPLSVRASGPRGAADPGAVVRSGPPSPARAVLGPASAASAGRADLSGRAPGSPSGRRAAPSSSAGPGAPPGRAAPRAPRLAAPAAEGRRRSGTGGAASVPSPPPPAPQRSPATSPRPTDRDPVAPTAASGPPAPAGSGAGPAAEQAWEGRPPGAAVPDAALPPPGPRPPIGAGAP